MAKKKEKKVFVLDTNIILHTDNAIYQFGEHDLEIPVVVITEVDTFKKNDDTKGDNAREFSRRLSELSGDKLFNGGVSLGKKRGKITVAELPGYSQKMKRNFPKRNADHEILNFALVLQEQERQKQNGRSVVLVSQDNNLRLKAKSLKINAEPFESDSVSQSEIDKPYDGVQNAQASADLVAELYKNGVVDAQKVAFESEPFPNEFIILNKGGKSTAICIHKKSEEQEHGELHLIKKNDVGFYDIKAKNARQGFILHALLDPGIKFVTIGGKAGTGKTFISLLAAILQLESAPGKPQDSGSFDKIVFTRELVPVGRDLGYLPGDTGEKITPYMQGIYDNFQAMTALVKNRKGKDLLAKVEEEMKIQAISQIRGRSFVNSFFIVDEAQNLSPHEVKTIITRAGDNTKVILLGDEEQIDNTYLTRRNNGLTYAITRMKVHPIHAHVTLYKGERSELAEVASKLL